jgi:hypothetical protein
MRSTRARLLALAVVTSAAAIAAVLALVLAHAGIMLCSGHLAESPMAGMTMPAAQISGESVDRMGTACPLLVAAALAAGACALVALLGFSLLGAARVAVLFAERAMQQAANFADARARLRYADAALAVAIDADGARAARAPPR